MLGQKAGDFLGLDLQLALWFQDQALTSSLYVRLQLWCDLWILTGYSCKLVQEQPYLQQKSGMRWIHWQHRKQFWSSKPLHASVRGKITLLPEKDFVSSIFSPHIEEKLQIKGNH